MGGRGSSGAGGGSVNMAALTGTERQIQYATDLRRKANQTINAAWAESLEQVKPNSAQRRQGEENFRLMRETLNSEPSAATLINNLKNVDFNADTKTAFVQTFRALNSMYTNKK